MKKLLILSCIVLAFSACQTPCPETNENSQREIERLKIKLEATEAQLINVSAELSKLKNKSDSVMVKQEMN